MKGPNRECGENGLPQGSVISPILFKFFLHDFEESFDDRNNIVIYNFADDGTVKVSGNNVRNEDCDERYRCMDETVENGDKLSEGQNRTHSFFTGGKTTTTTVVSNTS